MLWMQTSTFRLTTLVQRVYKVADLLLSTNVFPGWHCATIMMLMNTVTVLGGLRWAFRNMSFSRNSDIRKGDRSLGVPWS